MARLLDLAEAHRDWRDARLHAPAARPAGLPRPPPARLLLDARARRDPLRGSPRARRWRCRSAPARSPGSTGTSTAGRPPRSSASPARRRTPSTRSPTATSPSTTCTRRPSARRTSRGSGAEIVLWSSQEFGFCEPGDAFASGSSIMPQKKNPDAAELLRAKAPRVTASLTTLLGVLHALPLAYAKDLQEDKEALFDAVDTIELCLEAAERHARRAALRPRAAWPPRPRTRWWRRPTSPTCWCARACRSARPTGSSAGWCGTPSSPGARSPSSSPEEARVELGAARRRVLRGARARGPGSTRRSRPAARPRRASPSSSRRRARVARVAPDAPAP